MKQKLTYRIDKSLLFFKIMYLLTRYDVTLHIKNIPPKWQTEVRELILKNWSNSTNDSQAMKPVEAYILNSWCPEEMNKLVSSIVQELMMKQHQTASKVGNSVSAAVEDYEN